MQATGNASGSSDLPRLRDCAAEQAAMATAAGLFQPSPRQDGYGPAPDPKMKKAARMTGVSTGVSSGATTGMPNSTPTSTSLKRRSSDSNMRVDVMDTEDSTPGTPANQMIQPPKEPPAAPHKARLLRPVGQDSFDDDDNQLFASQLRTRLDSVFQATQPDEDRVCEH